MAEAVDYGLHMVHRWLRMAEAVDFDLHKVYRRPRTRGSQPRITVVSVHETAGYTGKETIYLFFAS